MNLRSAMMVVPALLLGWLAWWVAGRQDVFALFVCGVTLIAADLALRWRSRRGQLAAGTPANSSQWLLAPSMGGSLTIVPLWAIGAIQLGAAVARSLGATG
ncbi:MAG: hypothetical protein U0168_03050 [Nannocystaceae bacterium]